MTRFLLSLFFVIYSSFCFSQNLTQFNHSYFQLERDGNVGVEEIQNISILNSQHLFFELLNTNRNASSVHKRYSVKLNEHIVKGIQITSHYNFADNKTSFFIPKSIPQGVFIESEAIVTKEELREKVRALFKSSEYVYLDFPRDNLEEGLIYVSRNNKYDNPDWVLALQIDVQSHEPLFGKRVSFHAATGELLFTENKLCTSHEHALTSVPGTAVTKYHGEKQIETTEVNGAYVLLDETRGMGLRTVNRITGEVFKDHDNFWDNKNYEQDEVAGDAHWGCGFTFDFFKNHLDLEGLDGNGAGMTAAVHEDYAGAYWVFGAAYFGDGLPTSDYDLPSTYINVIAHEYAHGVEVYASNLIYDGESGGLSEAFADIIGVSVENASNPGIVDWKIGEEYSSSGAYFRDMSNPNSKQMAATYGGVYFDANDGVHSLSSIANLWFYLLVEGGSDTNDFGYNYDVAPLGWEKATRLAFGTWTNYLTSSSDYNDCASFSLVEAENLYGECSDEFNSVVEAWNAVGLLLDLPSVDFEASETYICDYSMSTTFQADRELTNIEWHFGDGGNSNETNPTHTYMEAGSYTVSVSGIDCEGNEVSNEKEDYIYVNENGFACDTLILAGENELFKCSGTIIDDGGLDGDYSLDNFNSVRLTNEYDLGYIIDVKSFSTQNNLDRMYIRSLQNGEYIEHYYLSGDSSFVGEQIILLADEILITFESSFSTSASGFVIDYTCILPSAPIANFYTSNTLSCSPNVQFYDSSSNLPTTWEWYVNEEQASIEQNPALLLPNDGVHDIKLIACNAEGCDTIIKESYITLDQASLYCDTVSMDNNLFSIQNECTGVIIDDGGANGDYGSNLNSHILLDVPDATGYELDFSKFSIETGDFIKVYSITDVDTFLYIDNSDISEGMKIEIPGEKVLVEFTTGPWYEAKGFVIDWTCIIPESKPTVNFDFSFDNCLKTLSLQNLTSPNASDFEWKINNEFVSSLPNPEIDITDIGNYTITFIACNIFGCDTMTVVDAISLDAEALACDTLIMLNGAEYWLDECEGVLYDDGGPDGNFSNDFYAVANIEAAGANHYNLTFSLDGVGTRWDALWIYGWNGYDYVLFGQYYLDVADNMLSLPTSKLRIVWQTNASHSAEGFELHWSCNETLSLPNPSFSLENEDFCQGSTKIINTTVSLVDSWNWYIDGELVSTEYEPTFTYLDFDEHSIQLEACNEMGCVSSSIQNFTRLHCIASGLIEACEGTLYDDGGLQSEYTANELSETIIHTENAAGFLLNILEFETEYDFDELVISSGNDLANLTPFMTLSGKVLATSYIVMGEYVKFAFSSDNSGQRDGFAIEYECISNDGLPVVATDYEVETCSNVYVFTANSINADNYSWDFGNGDVLTGETVSYTFPEIDDYTVVLTISNEQGTINQNIVIDNNFIPLAVKEIGEILINTTESITINSHSPFSLNSRKWYVNGQDAGNGVKLDINFPTVSTNIIRCEIEDENDCFSMIEQTVEARAALNTKNYNNPSHYTLFPNPVYEYFDIKSEIPFLDGSEIFIYDMAGKLVFTKGIPNNSDQMRINTSTLIDGLYMLRIQENNKQSYIKFVKN